MTGKKQNKQDEAEIKLPLPLEYCTVERAARLLGCEVEDIHHWHEIGAIQLCVKLDDVKCLARIIPISLSNLEDPRDMAVEEVSRVLQFGHLGFLSPRDYDLYCGFVDGKDGVNFESEYATLIGCGDMELQGDLLKTINYDAIVSGFWVDDAVNFFTSSVTLRPLGDMAPVRINGQLQDVCIKGLEVSGEHIDKCRFVMKQDLELLHTAIQTGKSLPNRYNDAEIAAKMQEQEDQTGKTPTRVRNEQVVLTQELVKRVLNMDTIDQPSKQAEALLTELSSSVPVENLPSARSITRYLGGK